MLKELHIENIAVIEQADIEFNPGLNVLTGETGAGKSIIIDSLNAVLGSRTSRDLVRTGADSGRVSAVFQDVSASDWFISNDIPEEDTLILQRKISADGKTGCRVNGQPVSASQLRELSASLIDIHGQNDGMRLLDERSHLGFLDGFGVDKSYIDAFAAEYKKYTDISSEIKALSLDEDEKLRLGDTLRYQIAELEKADIRAGEYDELRERRDMMRNSEKLREALDSALGFLYDGDENALSYIRNARYFAERASSITNSLEGASTLIGEAEFSLTDAAEQLNDFRMSLDFSPSEYDELESRISRIDRLRRKYLRDEQGLIELLEESRDRLDRLEYSGERLAKLSRQLAQEEELCRASAARLSQIRKETAERLKDRVVKELRDLNMPSVRFEVEFVPLENETGFNATGADEIRFIMSANAGEEPGRISKIASGGELSRIMLSLKNVFAENDPVGTMIFDEIDSGVSGISAQRVAEKLYSVSRDRQVMCVSHLPQIAAMADSQYLVSKSERSGRTFTNVTELDRPGRMKEIARLYGGDNITETTLSAAEEQLNAASIFKKNL